MSQPVTTNPLIIMLINMTVVFLVLIALGIVINLIHKFDPTVKKEEPEEAPAKVVSAPAAASAPKEPVFEGVSPEIAAVIAAAVASYGGIGAVRAIRPIERNGWKQSGRAALTERTM